MTLLMPAVEGLSRRQSSHLSRAGKLAKRSSMIQRHGAVVVKGGSVLAQGFNSYTNDPRDFSVDYFSPGNLSAKARHKLSIHAELAALKKLAPDQARGATVYVARVSPRGDFLLSEPCEACAAELKRLGVKRVIYT